MESALKARNGYAQATRQIRTARNIEYDVFAQITSRLRALSPSAEDYPALVEALQDNRELWTILAIDVADRDNALPASLRARLFYLAEFTFLHTSRILAGNADPLVLVEINSAVMGGLRNQSAAA